MGMPITTRSVNQFHHQWMSHLSQSLKAGDYCDQKNN